MRKLHDFKLILDHLPVTSGHHPFNTALQQLSINARTRATWGRIALGVYSGLAMR